MSGGGSRVQMKILLFECLWLVSWWLMNWLECVLLLFYISALPKVLTPSFGCVLQQNRLSWAVADVGWCFVISCKFKESCIDFEHSIANTGCLKRSLSTRVNPGLCVKAEIVQCNRAWLSRRLKPFMLTCSWYILGSTAACGFQCPGWRAADAKDSLGIRRERQSRTNRSNWGQSGEAGDAGEVLTKGAEVSQDCWMFHWWHGTHGQSSAAANASCPPGRSVGGSNRVTANSHTETSRDLHNTTV